MYKNRDYYKEQQRKYLIENWILCLFLITLILGADTFAEWGAEMIEAFFTYIGVL